MVMKKDTVRSKKKAKGQSTLYWYDKYKKLKERNLEKLKQEIYEKERSLKKAAIKQNKGSELQHLSSFDKQANSVEFMEFMSKEYNFDNEVNV